MPALDVLVAHNGRQPGMHPLCEMRRDVYWHLVRVLSLPTCAWPHYELIAARFRHVHASSMLKHTVLELNRGCNACRVPVETVISIYMQQAQLHVKKTNPIVKNAASEYAIRFAV